MIWGELVAELNYACIACQVNMAYHKATGLRGVWGHVSVCPEKILKFETS